MYALTLRDRNIQKHYILQISSPHFDFPVDTLPIKHTVRVNTHNKTFFHYLGVHNFQVFRTASNTRIVKKGSHFLPLYFLCTSAHTMIATTDNTEFEINTLNGSV